MRVDDQSELKTVSAAATALWAVSLVGEGVSKWTGLRPVATTFMNLALGAENSIRTEDLEFHRRADTNCSRGVARKAINPGPNPVDALSISDNNARPC